MGESNFIPTDILDDLSCRFIINIPAGEKTDFIRLFFQIELAHWFYIDFYRAENPQLKACGMKEFTKHILKHIPGFSFMLSDLQSHFDMWKEYKMSVPTYGAIVLNEDMSKVLLVQSFYEKASWGFPKGKVNEDECPVNCAVREVMEETGLDINKLIQENEFIEAVVCDQTIRLYIIHGVRETEKFHPKTRNEIKGVEWFTINDLPTNKKDITPKIKIGVRPNSFFMILPFVKRIRFWIQEKRGESPLLPANRRRTRHKSVSDLQPSPSYNGSVKNSQQPTTNDMELDIQNLKLSAKKTRKALKSKEKMTISSATFYRRQLFDHLQDNLQKDEKTAKCSAKHQFDDSNFVVPRWLNFRLDRAALIRCFDI